VNITHSIIAIFGSVSLATFGGCTTAPNLAANTDDSGQRVPLVSAAIANDKGDDSATIQSEIDRVAAAGGGILQLERGTYDLSRPLYLRSFVTVAGRGAETVLTNERFSSLSNWGGTTIFAGNLSPASFVYNNGKGYSGVSMRIDGPRKISLTSCTPDQNYSALVGQPVWLASEASMVGAGEFDRPVENEMNLVTGVEGCSIMLADPITIKPATPARFFWSDGSLAVHKGLEANVAIRGAVLRDLQVRSLKGQTLISSGCYACVFENITMGKARRLLVVQGSRNSVYRGIGGKFSERGIEITMFANGNLIENINAEYEPDPEHAPKPAIRFGEYSRNNVLRNIDLRLHTGYDAQTKIRFDESEGNRLENVRISVDAGSNRSNIAYQGPGEVRATRGVLPPGTEMVNVQFCRRGATERSMAQCEAAQ
jgi:hypothetical protein